MLRQQCLTIGLGNTHFNLGLFYSIDKAKLQVLPHTVGYLAKDSESLPCKLRVLLTSSLFPTPPDRLTTLHFASHIPGYILCATRHREMSSRISNGSTCIIPVKIKRKLAENKRNLFLLSAMLAPKHLSIQSVYFKSRKTMFVGMLKKSLFSLLEIKWCCWHS